MRKKEFTLMQLCISVLIPVAMLFAVIYGNDAVTAIYEGTPLTNRRTVIIDAGHGGEDGGAVSISGIHESQLNLQISLRLEDLLNLLGIRTVLIRSNDKSVYTQGDTISQRKVSDLKERVRIINSQRDPLLISIHQNYFIDSRYSGAQVFYAGTPGSDILAQQLQSDFVSALNPGSNRKAKKSSGIYLMEHIKATGVLIECGFLSNPAEEALLSTPDYQMKVCCVIASSVSKFLYSDSVA